MNFKRDKLYKDSLDWIKRKKATKNPINKEDNIKSWRNRKASGKKNISKTFCRLI